MQGRLVPIHWRKVDKLWTAFARNCDFYGLTDFYGLQNLAVREMIEAGDILGLKITDRSAAVPLKLQLREIDHLDSSRVMMTPSGGYTDQGLEYDAAGRRTGYWMFPQHPGGNRMMFTNGFLSERIGADRVLHMFERQRVQNRGVPWAAPAVLALRDLGDWRGKILARMRALILAADPAMIEERKWKKPSNAMAGVPVWSHHGIVCTGEAYTKVVKLTFARGARIPDPKRLFNSSLEGNTRRAIDIHEGEKIDAAAFKTLVKACIDHKTGLTTGGHNIMIDIIPNDIATACLNIGKTVLDNETSWFTHGGMQVRSSP